MIDANPVSVFLILCALVYGYFLPVIIAWLRNHHQRTAILLLNLLLGWTFLGWVASMIWAATAIPSKETTHA